MSPGTKLGSELEDTSKQTNENGQVSNPPPLSPHTRNYELKVCAWIWGIYFYYKVPNTEKLAS